MAHNIPYVQSQMKKLLPMFFYVLMHCPVYVWCPPWRESHYCSLLLIFAVSDYILHFCPLFLVQFPRKTDPNAAEMTSEFY